MYQQYFNLTDFPFENTPDQKFYFDTPSHNETIEAVMYTLNYQKGISIIIGPPGTGKTLLIQRLKKSIEKEGHLIHEADRLWPSTRGLFKMIPSLLGLKQEEGEDSKTTLMSRVTEKLQELSNRGKRFVILIDEAQQLTQFPLESLRRVATLEGDNKKLVQIILAAHPDFLEALQNPFLEALRQRIAFTQILKPLDKIQTSNYIKHRLEMAGGNSNIFQPSAISLIYAATNGTPRLINQLCDNCLIAAFNLKRQLVDDEIAKLAIQSCAATLTGSTSNPHSPSTDAESTDHPTSQSSIEQHSNSPVQNQPYVSSAGIEAANFETPQSPPASNFSTQYQQAAPPPGHMGQSVPPMMPPARNSIDIKRWGIIAAAAVAIVVVLIGLYKFLAYTPSQNAMKGMHSNQQSNQIAQNNTKQSEEITPVASSTSTDQSPILDTGLWHGTKVTVSSAAQLEEQIRLRYGTINSTYADLIQSANPSIPDIQAVNSEIEVNLPSVSYDNLIVKRPGDSDSWFLYFASLDNAADAELESSILGNTHKSVMTSKIEHATNSFYRIFIGPYSGYNQAETAAMATWFKFIPSLN